MTTVYIQRRETLKFYVLKFHYIESFIAKIFFKSFKYKLYEVNLRQLFNFKFFYRNFENSFQKLNIY